MREFHKIWIDQCEAAGDIRNEFGLQKALGYLIGEKFLNFLRAADQDADFAGEVPSFVEEIKRVFDQAELRAYLDGVRRVGPLAHTPVMRPTRRCAKPESSTKIRSTGPRTSS